MPSPYATSEDHLMLWYEQAIYASTHIGAVAFGILIAVYYLATYYGLRQKKVLWGWVAFNSTLVILATVNIATSIHFNESAWIDERNYPGGPFAFFLEQQYRPVQTVSNTAFLIGSVMNELLLIYRVFVVWRPYQWYITVVPTLLFLVCTALSVVSFIQTALPFSPTWNRIPNLSFITWLLSIILDLLLVLLLVTRLLYMRHKLRVTMGNEYGKMYTSIAAIVVESALPLGILSIVYLVLFGRKDPTQLLFIPLLSQVAYLSPMLIILRVIRGRAWSSKTLHDAQISTAKFATGNPSSMVGTGAQSIIGTNEVSELTFKHHSESEIEEEGNKYITDIV